MDTRCKQCGRCCYFIIDGKPVKCKHLVYITHNHRICRIYNRKDRVGMKITMPGLHNGICIYRIESEYDYVGCLYNTGTKPIFEGKFGDVHYEKRR